MSDSQREGPELWQATGPEGVQIDELFTEADVGHVIKPLDGFVERDLQKHGWDDTNIDALREVPLTATRKAAPPSDSVIRPRALCEKAMLWLGKNPESLPRLEWLTLHLLETGCTPRFGADVFYGLYVYFWDSSLEKDCRSFVVRCLSSGRPELAKSLKWSSSWHDELFRAGFMPPDWENPTEKPK
jgi:hypothetical protein